MMNDTLAAGARCGHPGAQRTVSGVCPLCRASGMAAS